MSDHGHQLSLCVDDHGVVHAFWRDVSELGGPGVRYGNVTMCTTFACVIRGSWTTADYVSCLQCIDQMGTRELGLTVPP